MGELPNPLRVALLAGTLEFGGAEKQLVYMARALQGAGVCVRVYTLGKNEVNETALRDIGLDPIAVGLAANPVLRLVRFARAVRAFRPHVIQASTFYVNLYVAVVARVCRALSIGAIRSDIVWDLRHTGCWGPLLLRAPAALVTNSHAAHRAATRLGIDSDKVHVVPNVIETSAFEQARWCRPAARNAGEAVALFVGQLVTAKRADRFLNALALARRSVPGLKGLVVGDGPERPSLEAYAGRLGLLPGGVQFSGWSHDVPRLMAEADMLVLTSDLEGCPNVILEAMAARLPVVTTPAGDAPVVVEHGVSGFVVPFHVGEELTDHLVHLARSPALRHELGEAGYERVTAQYACTGLADRLLAVYRATAQQRGRLHVLDQRQPQARGDPVRRMGPRAP